jgi:lipopolysaccharide transport system ATP-binding protein
VADSDIAISVEGLAKRYLIGHETSARGRDSFRDMMVRSARGLGRTAMAVVRGRQLVAGDTVEEFWALKDVSFEVRRGEVMGVIGRNGAGKSTLLKILSRITEPTRGRAVIRGRVASLLEVGTGFHPELTGRENIYLNGAILGMTRAEIAAKFDEIVDFAEVEKFLDTPVKRYSSGMYVRLAFAVAAHLEPEILVIDEVLAVGDVAFQRKCLGKMQNVAAAGRTILFVSHNLASISELASRAVLLERGSARTCGPTAEVISAYLKTISAHSQKANDLASYRRDDRVKDYVDITSVTVCGHDFGAASIEVGDPLWVEVGLAVYRPLEKAIVVINILDEQLSVIAALASFDANFEFAFEPGDHTIRCNIPTVPFVPGNYHLALGVAEPGQPSWDALEMLPGFRVAGEESVSWMKWPRRPGVLLLQDCAWSEISGGPTKHICSTIRS